MSELKIKYKDDNEFKCVRRIACKLGLSMPDSDDDILNLSQFRRIDRAINAEFESMKLLTVIATKHATRADELYEALEKIMPAVKQYIEYEHDGDPWTEDARSMGEMDLNELDKEGVIEELFSILDKSRIEAEKGDGICN